MANPTRAKGDKRVVARCLQALTGAGAFLLPILAFAGSYTVDDAFIAARYASNLARGFGYAMNPDAMSDGVTGPLALLLPTLATWLGGDPLLTAKWVGVAASAAAIAMVCGLQRRLRAALVAALFCALSLPLVAWAGAGLETGLATLAFTLLFIRSRQTSATRAHTMVEFSAALSIAWLRPELFLAAAALVGFRDVAERRLSAGAIGLAASVVSIFFFRLIFFGTPLPIAFFAKPASVVQGFSYALRSGLVGLWLVALPLTVIVGRQDRTARQLGVALGVHLLALTLAGGDWMPGFRLLVPLIPAVAFVLARPFGRESLPSYRLMAGALCGLVFGAFYLAVEAPRLTESAAQRRAAAAGFAALAEGAGCVAAVDVGFLAHHTGVRVFDLGGVTDPSVARLAGGHLDKAVTASMLEQRGVDRILLHSSLPPRVQDGRLVGLAGYPVEQRVWAMRWVQLEFEVGGAFEYAPGYHYVWLRRR